MPIKGVVNVIPYQNRVEKIPLFQQGYLDPFDFVATRPAGFLDLQAGVLFDLAHEPYPDFSYIRIKRIGSGLSEEDFELDFTEFSKWNFLFIESSAMYTNLMKEKENYVVFTRFQFLEEDQLVTAGRKDMELIESMHKQMLAAGRDGSLDLAIALKKKIRKAEKDLRQKNKKEE